MRRRATLLPMVVALLEPLADNLLGPPGGQGAVYKAKTADGYIAVKVYFDKPAPSQSAERCLQDELAMLKAVQGQNVLRCLGDDMVESVPPPKPHSYAKHCLKLVLAAKGDLFKHAFCSGPRIKVDDVRTLSKQMVEGVKHIHSQGYAHLDIKPENMLIDANGTLMIADFGLARKHPVGSRMPASDVPHGTPGFASPELTERSNKDALGLTDDVDCHAVDVWALGASILMLCVHANPFACIDARPVGGILEPVQEYVARRSAIYLNMRGAQKKKEDNPVGEAYTGRFEAYKGKFEKMVKKRPDLKTLPTACSSSTRRSGSRSGRSPTRSGRAGGVSRVGRRGPGRGGRRQEEEPRANVRSASQLFFVPLLGADADDEAKAPQYTSCSASAVGDSAPGAAYRSALSDDEDDDLSILPPVRANAGTLILG